MSFSLTNTSYEISNSEQPFLISKSNSALFIENFRLSNFNNPLFILHPADESIGSPVLEVKVKNLKF